VKLSVDNRNVLDGKKHVPELGGRDNHRDQLNGEFESECRYEERRRMYRRLPVPKEHH